MTTTPGERRRTRHAKAQKNRREKLRKRGFVQVNVLLSKEARRYIREFANDNGLRKGDAVERIISEHRDETYSDPSHPRFDPERESREAYEQPTQSGRPVKSASQDGPELPRATAQSTHAPGGSGAAETPGTNLSDPGELLREAIFLFGLHHRHLAEGGVVSYDELLTELPKYLDMALERNSLQYVFEPYAPAPRS